MSLFKIFFNKFTITKSPIYGRWCLDYDHLVQDRKIYLANMDNCGCCGNIEEFNKSNKSIDNTKNDHKKPFDEYLYLYLYF